VQEDQHISAEEMLRELQAALPHEKTRPLFRTLLSWGRYAEIISYDQRRHIVRLYEARPAAKAKARPPAEPPAPPVAPAAPAEPAGDQPPAPPGPAST
jgi:hypothetical protein